MENEQCVLSPSVVWLTCIGLLIDIRLNACRVHKFFALFAVA